MTNAIKEVANRVLAVKAPTSLTVKLGTETMKVSVEYVHIGGWLSIKVATKEDALIVAYYYRNGKHVKIEHAPNVNAWLVVVGAE